MTSVIPESHSTDSTTASLGMTLFLAAEGMFFLGLFSALTVIGPAHRDVFRRSAAQLSSLGLIASILCLTAMSAVAWRQPWHQRRRWAAILLALIFLGLQALQYSRLLRRETVIVPVDGKIKILDGITAGDKKNLTVTGTMFDLPDQFDPHEVLLPAGGSAGTFTVPAASATDRESYGPGRSNFFASYFLLTGVHAVHLIGGMAALFVVTIRRRPRCPAVVMYWHTMNAVGAICLITFWLA